MSIFPFMDVENEENITDELPVFKEYAYDFENNCLKYKAGKTYLVEKNDALKIWIYKALTTERFRYLAYTAAFGNEAHTLIGYTMNSEITYSELRRFIVEALMVNPYIEELTNFRFEKQNSGVKVFFDVTTIYGDMDYFIEWEV